MQDLKIEEWQKVIDAPTDIEAEEIYQELIKKNKRYTSSGDEVVTDPVTNEDIKTGRKNPSYIDEFHEYYHIYVQRWTNRETREKLPEPDGWQFPSNAREAAAWEIEAHREGKKKVEEWIKQGCPPLDEFEYWW